jgi:nitrate reductase NapAB chaperone NapD
VSINHEVRRALTKGIRALHTLLADHADDPGKVIVGIETDRSLWVDALTSAGYQV